MTTTPHGNPLGTETGRSALDELRSAYHDQLTQLAAERDEARRQARRAKGEAAVARADLASLTSRVHELLAAAARHLPDLPALEAPATEAEPAQLQQAPQTKQAPQAKQAPQGKQAQLAKQAQPRALEAPASDTAPASPAPAALPAAQDPQHNNPQRKSGDRRKARGAKRRHVRAG